MLRKLQVHFDEMSFGAKVTTGKKLGVKSVNSSKSERGASPKEVTRERKREKRVREKKEKARGEAIHQKCLTVKFTLSVFILED